MRSGWGWQLTRGRWSEDHWPQRDAGHLVYHCPKLGPGGPSELVPITASLKYLQLSYSNVDCSQRVGCCPPGRPAAPHHRPPAPCLRFATSAARPPRHGRPHPPPPPAAPRATMREPGPVPLPRCPRRALPAPGLAPPPCTELEHCRHPVGVRHRTPLKRMGFPVSTGQHSGIPVRHRFGQPHWHPKTRYPSSTSLRSVLDC